MSNLIDKVQGNLESQYTAFRVCMWLDLILGCLFAANGDFHWAFGLVIVGLILGQVSNSKLLLMNQELFLQSQMRLEDKLDVLLEEGVQ